MSKSDRLNSDHEIVQAAFALVVTIDKLNDEGQFETMRLHRDERGKEFFDMLMATRQRLADAIIDNSNPQGS